MDHNKTLGLALLLTVAIAACKGSGSKDEAGSGTAYVPVPVGSRPAEVVDRVGEPREKVVDGNTVIWVYAEGTELVLKGGLVIKTPAGGIPVGKIEYVKVKVGESAEKVLEKTGEPAYKLVRGDRVVWVYERGSRIEMWGGKVTAAPSRGVAIVRKE